MKIDRKEVGVAGTVRMDFTADGVLTDPTPDAATVAFTRESDGTTIGPVDCYDEGEGRFSHTLSPTDTATLDNLTAVWTVTYGGYANTFVSRVEIVGGFLFNLYQARQLDGLNRPDPTKPSGWYYEPHQLEDARTLAETTLEDPCNRAFVPRFATDTINGTGTSELMLRPEIRSIRSVTVDGTAYTSGQLAGLAVNPSGLVTNTLSRFPVGASNIVVKYEYGASYPPPRVGNVALLIARANLVNGPIDERTSTFATTDGGTYSLIVPGQGGSWVGLPEADAVIDQYTLRPIAA
jgi:hypothetical protein